jgi:hypothetical protein
MKIVQKHNRSDWTLEQDNSLKEKYKRYVSGRYLDWVKDFITRDTSLDTTLWALKSSLYYTGHYATSDDYTYTYLYYTNQVNLAFFKYSMNDGEEVELELGGQKFTKTGQFKPNNAKTGCLAVIYGIELAFIMRDKAALEYYATIPYSFTEKAGQEDVISELMLAIFQLMIKGEENEVEFAAVREGITQHLDWDFYRKFVTKTAFLDEYMWKILHGYQTERVEFLFFPLIDIYERIYVNDAAGFNEAVYQALLKFQQYHTKQYVDYNKEEYDRSQAPEGYWALSIIAACAVAYDRGLSLTDVSSDYLCDWMISGNFEGSKLMYDDFE